MTSVRLRKPGHHPLVRNGIHLMIHKYQETKKSYLKLRANILRARGARTLFQCSLYAWDRVATQHVFLSVGPKKKKKFIQITDYAVPGHKPKEPLPNYCTVLPEQF